MFRCLFLVCVFLSSATIGQEGFLVEGLVRDSLSGGVLPFVTVLCPESKVGTVTNETGSFELKVLNPDHQLEFRFVGYSSKKIRAKECVQRREILLTEQRVFLSEIVVRPDDYWIHELLSKCKKKKFRDPGISKGYFQLETSVDDELIELIESYYNIESQGYDIKALKLKNGRVGVKFIDGRAFLSGEGSKAMQLYSLFNTNEYFPRTPLNTKASQIRKHFQIELIRRYHDENGREIVLLKFQPKSDPGGFFTGKIWIDVEAASVIRIDVHIPDAEIYPFTPLWSVDSLKKVSMDISRSYHIEGDLPVFDHLDFNYELHYDSRDTFTYVLRTKALLQAYDPLKPFDLPYFSFREDRLTDYRKLNAIPPDDKFWNDTSQFRMEINRSRNERYFSDPEVFSHDDLFRFNRQEKKGIHECPYMHWNGNRIDLRAYMPDSTAMDPRYPGFPRDQYKLSIQIFLDAIQVGDSLEFISSTVFDPYDSFYNLPADQKSKCFVNMYFDLAESWRRKMMTQLEGVRSRTEMKRIYDQTLLSWQKEADIFISEARRGENKNAMEKWNSILMERIGIDNITFFNPFPPQSN